MDTKSFGNYGKIIPLKVCDEDSVETASYTTASGPLPAHFRSITMKERTYVTDSLHCQSKPVCSSKVVCVILTLIFVSVTSLAISVAAVKIIQILNDNDLDKPFSSPKGQFSHPTEAVLNGNTSPATDVIADNVPDVSPSENRTRCEKSCWVFRAPWFQSRCRHGYCVCNGTDYQRETCLPKVDGCLVTRRQGNNTGVYLMSKTMPVYRCTAQTDSSRDVHVIGINANYYVQGTVVVISGHSNKPMTIVLANYHPVRWKLKYEALNIQNIYLASMHSDTSVEIEYPALQNTVEGEPTVSRVPMECGYGEDRYVSRRTADMLHTISATIGPIRTFTGAEFATRIELKLPV